MVSEEPREIEGRCRPAPRDWPSAVEIVRAQDHFGASGDMILWRLQNERLIDAAERNRLKEDVNRHGTVPLARSLGYDFRRFAQPFYRAHEVALRGYAAGEISLGGTAMEDGAVADASLLLSLGEASALYLLWDDPERTWHITPVATSEVRSDPTRSELSRAILSGRLAVAELGDSCVRSIQSQEPLELVSSVPGCETETEVSRFSRFALSR